MATTSKSPKRILQVAYAVAQKSMRPYAHRFSPKKFTQHQLFACLVLKEAMKLDYRGITAFLEDSRELAQTIGMQVVPHFTTLQKASRRLLRCQRVNQLLDETIKLARTAKLIKRRIDVGAIDSSGFEAHHVSRYFVKRCESTGKYRYKKHRLTYRRFPKLGILCDCRSHLILAAVAERGPSPDFGHLDPVLTHAERRAHIGTLLADAGYDAEWIHMFARLIFGTRTVIPAEHGRPSDKLPRGYYRRLMRTRFNKKRYGQRSQVETVFSVIKRRLSEYVNARTYWSQCRALLLKALTHNILIVALRKLFYRAVLSCLL